MKRLHSLLSLAALLGLAAARPALAYTISGSGQKGVLGEIETQMISWGSFATTTYGMLVIMIGAAVAVTTWIILPKNGLVGIGGRMVIGMIGLLNLGAIVTYFTYGTSS